MTYTALSSAVAAFKDMIDEVYPEAEVMGLNYLPSRVLDELDPVAFKCYFLDWADSEGIDTDELEDDYTFSRDRV